MPILETVGIYKSGITTKKFQNDPIKWEKGIT